MKKKTETGNPFKGLGVGYAHYLRNGAGVHQDKKKEQKRKQCRGKLKASQWRSYFLPGMGGKDSADLNSVALHNITHKVAFQSVLKLLGAGISISLAKLAPPINGAKKSTCC